MASLIRNYIVQRLWIVKNTSLAEESSLDESRCLSYFQSVREYGLSQISKIQIAVLQIYLVFLLIFKFIAFDTSGYRIYKFLE